MDAFGLYALAGALLGYIVGDIQREFRFRRDVRANLARAVDRTGAGPDSDGDKLSRSDGLALAVAGTDGDDHSDSPTHRTVRNSGYGQARRRAVSRPDFGNGSAAAVRRGGVHRSIAASVAGYDCG